MTEWHNVGEYRFGWDARLDSSRFVVLRRTSWWPWSRRFVPIANGRVEYGIVDEDVIVARARAAMSLGRGVVGADLRSVVFKTDDGADLDPRLCACMAGRWHEMQVRLRYGS